MTHAMPLISSAVLCCGVLLSPARAGVWSLGQPTFGATKGEPTGTRPAEPSLSGPQQQVAENATTGASLSLVERDIAGKVRRLQPSVEFAALEKISRAYGLTPTDRQEADRVLARRAAKLDAFVEANTDLLTKLGNSFAGTDKIDQAKLLVEAATKLQGTLLESPMETQVQAALPARFQKPFSVLVADYWDAIAQERLGDPATNKTAEGKPETRMAVLGHERTEAMGRQIELAFRRSLSSGSLAYSYIMKGVDVTEEQEPKVREFFAEHAAASKGDATDEQNKRLFWQVCSVLNAKQQAVVLKNINAITGKSPKGGKPAAGMGKAP